MKALLAVAVVLVALPVSARSPERSAVPDGISALASPERGGEPPGAFRRSLYGHMWSGWGAFVFGHATGSYLDERGRAGTRCDRAIMAASALGAAAGWLAVTTAARVEEDGAPATGRVLLGSLAGSAAGFSAWYALDRWNTGQPQGRARAMAVGGLLSVLLSGWLTAQIAR